MAYVGIMDHVDGSRSFDWSVADSVQYQAVVDARNLLNPVVQAFLVPAAYERTHQVNWSEITVIDLDRAGFGTTILYPRNRLSADLADEQTNHATRIEIPVLWTANGTLDDLAALLPKERIQGYGFAQARAYIAVGDAGNAAAVILVGVQPGIRHSWDFQCVSSPRADR